MIKDEKALFNNLKILITHLYNRDTLHFIEKLATIQQYHISDGLRFFYDYLLLIFHVNTTVTAIKEQKTGNTHLSFHELITIIENRITHENINNKVFVFYKKILTNLYVNYETYAIYHEVKEDMDIQPTKINNVIMNAKKDINLFYNHYLWPAKITIYDYLIAYIAEDGPQTTGYYKKIKGSLFYKSFHTDIKRLLHYFFKQRISHKPHNKRLKKAFIIHQGLYKKLKAYAKEQGYPVHKALHEILKSFFKK